MPRSKDRCEEDKRDEKGEKKNKIRMKARRCVGRRLDTRMDYEWESTGECGRVHIEGKLMDSIIYAGIAKREGRN